MFGFTKKMFAVAIGFIGSNVSGTPLKCVSMSNHKRKVRPVIMNINSNKTLFYHYSIPVNKCSGSCNNINDLCEVMCSWCCWKHEFLAI